VSGEDRNEKVGDFGALESLDPEAHDGKRRDPGEGHQRVEIGIERDGDRFPFSAPGNDLRVGAADSSTSPACTDSNPASRRS
jgi:hypothetical protein